MNENEFKKICKLSELKEKQGRRFYIDEVDVAVFKVDGVVYALSNICPHQHSTVMYDGFIENEKVVCPVHGWEFKLCDGTIGEGRKGLDSYEAKIENDDVYVKVFKRELKWNF